MSYEKVGWNNYDDDLSFEVNRDERNAVATDTLLNHMDDGIAKANNVKVGSIGYGNQAHVEIVEETEGYHVNFIFPEGAKGDKGDPGEPGEKGDPGDPGTIAIGTVATGEPGTSAAVSNTGTPGSAILNFTIPRGDKGTDGFSPLIVENSENNEDVYRLDITTKDGPFTTPNLKGGSGSGGSGTAATITVGEVTTGDEASVTNSGTSTNAVFDFVLPKGDKGDPGQDGADGAAATIVVGNVTTGDAGTDVQVTNSGTTNEAVFDFVIPKGEKGDKGDQGEQGPVGADGAPGADGADATIEIGDVTTVDSTEQAVVENVGTATAAILNFSIPKGEKGDKGDPFTIKKTYASVSAMNDDFSNGEVPEGSFVMIDTGNVEDEDNAKLYVKGAESFTFITDLSGATGITGPAGADGAPGQDGAAATIQIGQVTTGEAGTDATVTNSGTSSNAVLDFVIPKGEKGDKGDQGDTGATPNIQIGNVQTLEPGQQATASVNGTPENPLLNLGIPKGEGSVDPAQIEQAVNGYLEENPMSGMTAEQEQQLNQNTTDVADLKSAINEKIDKTGWNPDKFIGTDSSGNIVEKEEPTGESEYFEEAFSGTSTANGISLDISGLLEAYPSPGTWDSLHNWYLTHYNNSNNIAVSNGFEINKLVSKPIKGVCYFRGFASSSNQYIMNNNVRFYGCDSDKALEEEGHPCTLITSKKFQFFPVDELPDGSSGYGVIIVYPQEEYEYYYIELGTAYHATGTPNRSNPTWIVAFDSTVLDDPLMSISSNFDTFLKMKDEYLSGYYKNMFASEDFKNIFRNYYAQMAPKVGTPQTYGKAIYVAGDSLHAYAGGDGISTAGFMTNWNQYLGFSIIVNAGYAGSTWSETTGGGGLKRAKDLISSGIVYDVIILAWGTNDDTGGDGTIDDPASDAEGCTMAAAMKWIITNLRNTFKSTAIGVIIPPPKGTEDGMKTRGDLMIQVCELLHVPYVDMREYISISDLGSDTVHLGTGAGKYGAAEASLILRICQYGDTLYPGTID